MNEISVKTIFLTLLLSSIFANSINITDWIVDNDSMELCEGENKDAEKDETKPKHEKDEIFTENTKNSFISLLFKFSPDTNEINPHSIQCREVLTPPPDYL